MKASASILMVGLRSMKRPSGVAASSITATASRIATTMIRVWLAMPTAAITESSENTMSITAICAITIQNDASGLVWMSSDSCSPTMLSRISIVPFTTQEHAAQDQHQVAHRNALPEEGEQVAGQAGQPGQRQQQQDAGDAGHGDAELARDLALVHRQLADGDGDEHQVVDAQHDLDRTQRDQGHPDLGIGKHFKHGSGSLV